MLTRFEVRGFKNLVDVDLHLGPLTCIAGPNAVGKSNLFDAIKLLKELAQRPIIDAFAAVRRGRDELESLFTWSGSNRLELCAEMLIPDSGVDDFGQQAIATARFLRYELALHLQDPEDQHRIRIDWESLTCLTKKDAGERFGFDHSREWLDSVIARSTRRNRELISTTSEAEKRIIRLHFDRKAENKRGGRTQGFLAENLPRTVLSSAQNASESSTAVLVRRELQNWRFLSLEPSALHKPDTLNSPERLSENGEHLPGTLDRLCHTANGNDPERTLARIANRLAELVEGVRTLWVDRDDARRLLTLKLRDSFGNDIAASALSDGTLRFLALVVLENDPEVEGLICLEEPENGIHPGRLSAMRSLLEDMANDPLVPVGPDNPLRQVLVNTHSPSFAAIVPKDALLFARIRPFEIGGRRTQGAVFQALQETWRTKGGFAEPVAIGSVLSYLEGGGGLTLKGPATRAHETHPGQNVADHLQRQLQLFDEDQA